MSDSSISRSFPIFSSISDLAFSSTSGFLSRFAIAHSNVTAEVSVPASIIDFTISKTIR
uniref:Uncharacterized protein n=1 Tax=Arabidopsis thaliana TaxID=3702 RepID=Q56YC4_ARATH|nr:hypothetical protein [Arabidopsis thaliana]